MEGKQEEKKVSLFREKSLEAVESPEVLNDYLRVTTPGIWLVLAAVILLLAGGIVWSVFGRVDTEVSVAVSASAEGAVCFVPYQQLEGVAMAGQVIVNGQAWPLQDTAEARMMTVTEEMSPFLRIAGSLEIGDVAVEIPLNAQLEEGIYSGTVITESLQPISLLLQ